MERPQHSIKDNILDVVFGSIAGSAGKVIEYPFDTVKVRLQSQPDHVPLRFSGPFDCFKQTINKEGVSGLFRGISSPIVGAAIENASLFVTYNLAKNFIIKRFYSGNGDKVTNSTLVLCGGVSGAVTSFLLTPIELIKCKMQVESLYGGLNGPAGQSAPISATASAGLYQPAGVKAIHTTTIRIPTQGVLQHIVSVYRQDGLTGFWRGQMGTLLRESGGSAAWFGAYEYVTDKFRQRSGREKNTIGESMIAGACAGVSYNLSLFPADTVKSRMQTDSLVGGDSHNQGFITVAKTIYKNGGIRALYRGCGITIARAAPSSAIIFVTYEKLKEFGHLHL